MNKSIRFFLLVSAAAAVLAWVSAQGTELYTWKDKNGVVHYTDTPPDNPNAVSIEAPEAYLPGTTGAYPQDNSPDVTEGAEPAAAPANGMQNGNESYADQVRAQIAKKREEHRKEEITRTQNCLHARQQLATLEPSRRVFFTNAQGETERMDDVERVRLVDQAKAQIAKYCK